MGKASRDKGQRTERALVKLLQERGFAAERVPLSGSAGGRYVGDISVPLMGRDLIGEVKCRSHGFSQLYEWLGSHDFLVVKADRAEPLLVMPLKAAAAIAEIAERSRG
jgi:hypothetical protein